MVRPSALAVLRLITNSYLVDRREHKAWPQDRVRYSGLRDGAFGVALAAGEFSAVIDGGARDRQMREQHRINPFKHLPSGAGGAENEDDHRMSRSQGPLGDHQPYDY